MSRGKNNSRIIKVSGEILYGSIAEVKIRCGKKICPCRHDAKMQHGPYYQWTGFIRGKRTTKLLSKEIAQECYRRLHNYKLLLQQLDDLKEQAIKNAPWLTRPT